MEKNQTRKAGDLPTGSVMTLFGPTRLCGYGDYAPLPPELARLMEQLKEVEYPITSKSDFVYKLGGATAPLFVGDMAVEAGSAVMFLPASIFPAATVENLAEKLAAVYAQRSAKPAVKKISPAELEKLAKRFMSENAKLVQRVAQLVRWIALEKSQTIEKDSGALASRILRENYPLVMDIADAFYSIGALRAKTAEAMREQSQTPPPAE